VSSSEKRIRLNAFALAAPGHQSPGLWRHPDDQSHRYKDLDYWTELARVLERGRFDGLFLSDGHTPPVVYQGSHDASLTWALQAPRNEPTAMIPAMAAVTSHLGFGVTVAVTWEQPYHLARRLTTLDHLTKGRVGWNVVTTWRPDVGANMGMPEMPLTHDERYEQAEEYLEVCYKLWEYSWDADAVVVDRKAGMYTDPRKVREIGHKGKYFTVPGSFYAEPSPQRTPVIFQAGASPRGRDFAAKHAECVFIVATSTAGARYFVNDIRTRAAAHGRDPEDVKIFLAVSSVVAETTSEAQEKYEDYSQYVSYDATLAHFGGLAGMDLSQAAPDEPLEIKQEGTTKSPLEIFVKADPGRVWTPNEIVRHLGIGMMGPVVIGSPAVAADQIEELVDESGVDGLNLMCAVNPGSYVDFVDLVVPELQRRGRVWTDYVGGTAREMLYGAGQKLLLDRHPGAGYRP
jgi:FMN-dependent oxidoreductase (nitrilotriacetate monooxygenase family)